MSMLLSQNEDTCNIGQIRDLPAALKRNPICACQSHIKDCEFWTKVVDALPDEKIMQRVSRGYTKFRKDVREHQSWNRLNLRKAVITQHRNYLDALEILYSTTSKVAGEKVLVDSSKSPELAFALSLIPSISLYTLNLVRDPRAVVVSWAKRTSNNDRLASQAKKWRLRQKLFTKVENGNTSQFKRLRYEDLTANPRETVEGVLSWAGVDIGTSNFSSDTEAKVSWSDLHIFPPANEGVLAARATDIVIKASNSWKDQKNAKLIEMAEKIAFPAAEKYGYELDTK